MSDTFLDRADERRYRVVEALDEEVMRWCGHAVGGRTYLDGYDEVLTVMCERCAHFTDVVAFELGRCSACGRPTEGCQGRNAITGVHTATTERPFPALPGFVGEVRATYLRLCDQRVCVQAGDDYWRASKWAD